MAYSNDYRKRAIEYYHNGHTQAEVKLAFLSDPHTIRDWEARLAEGDIGTRYPKEHPKTKYPDDKVVEYITEHPDVYLREMAEHFGGSESGAAKALKRNDYSNKKKLQTTSRETSLTERNTPPK